MTEKLRDLISRARKSIDRLHAYCREEDWTGYDPYDALNSLYLKRISNKWTRILLTQTLRYLPFNLRFFLKIKKGTNPKALSLFIRALLKISSINRSEFSRDELKSLVERLMEMQSVMKSPNRLMSWGYDFPWQSRAFFCASFSPNIQSTIMGAHAFYELYKSELCDKDWRNRSKEVCLGANSFLVERLLMHEDEEMAILAYIPGDKTVVINIQAQAAWSLLRAFSLSGQRRFYDISLKLLRFVERTQHDNGSWYYGKASSQKFIDNFHTGFILEALHECFILYESSVSREAIERGYKFYIENFFKERKIPVYFPNKDYPVDSHTIAQSIITLSKLSRYDKNSGPLLENLTAWTLRHFQAEKGFFYYQKWPMFQNKISYMRWSQAWMYYALAHYLEMNEREELCVE